MAAVDKIEDQRKPEDFIGLPQQEYLQAEKSPDFSVEASCVRVTYFHG